MANTIKGTNMYKSTNLFPTKFALITILIIGTTPTSTVAEERYTGQCEMPPPENPDSPWDYRTRKDRIELVERRHFTRNIELLIRGESTANLAADIDYTLRMFPNHHRALASLVRYSESKKQRRFSGMKYSVECFLERAIYFKPDDLQVRIIYANYFAKNTKFDQSRKQLEYIENTQDTTSAANYNLGLIYLEIGDFEKSLHYAHKAYSDNFPLAGLKNKLKRIGKWRESRIDPLAPPDHEHPVTPLSVGSE